MKKKFAFMLAVTLFASGCGTSQTSTPQQNTPTSESSASAESTDNEDDKTESSKNTDDKNNKKIIVDDLGLTVEIPDNLERIVIADLPPLVHTFYVVNGSTENLAGALSENSIENTLLPIVFPEMKEVSSDFRKNGVLNIEELLSLEPDLILYRSDTPENTEMIQKTGIPAVAFQTTNGDNGNVVTPVASWIRMIADILDKDISHMDVELQAYESMGFVQSRLWDVEEKADTAYLTISEENINIIGAGQFGPFWSEIMHANDLGGNSFKGSQSISIEQLYELDPDVIFMSFSSITAEDFMNNPKYANLKAVENGRVYEAPQGIFTWFGPSTDIPLSFLWHAKLTYPEYFEDIDLVEITKTFYKDMYDYTMTNDDIEFLFKNSLGELYAK